MPDVTYHTQSGWGYNAYVNPAGGTLSNTSGTQYRVTSITVPCGYGTGEFYQPDYVSASGTFPMYLSCGGRSSNTLTISFQCPAAGGYYDQSRPFYNYTFSFQNLIIPPHTSWQVTFIKSGNPHTLCVKKGGGWCTFEVVEKPKYTVKYNMTEGSGEPPAAQETEVGTSTKVKDPHVREGEGPFYEVTFDDLNGEATCDTYTDLYERAFTSWNTKRDGSGRKYHPDDSIPSQDKDSVTTLYAQWGNAKITHLPPASMPNSRFLGWSKKKNDSSHEVKVGDSINKDTTLYPFFESTAKVTLHGKNNVYTGEIYDTDEPREDGVNPSESKVLKVPNSGRVKIPRTYSVYMTSTGTGSTDGNKGEPSDNAGSSFLGWSLSKQNKNPEYSNGAVLTPDGNMTLYAVYGLPSFTVKFVDGYHDGDAGIIKVYRDVPYDTGVEPPPDPVRPGFRFLGWNGNYTHVRKNTTITAQWSRTPIWIMTADKGWVRYEPKEEA